MHATDLTRCGTVTRYTRSTPSGFSPLGVDLVYLVTVPQRVRSVACIAVREFCLVEQWFGQVLGKAVSDIDSETVHAPIGPEPQSLEEVVTDLTTVPVQILSLIHISEPTRLGMISYAVFC